MTSTSLSGQRVTLVEQAVTRFNAGDYDRFLQIFSADVALLADPQVADRAEYRGHSGLTAWLGEARRRWHAVRFRALAVEPFGDGVIVELAVVGDTAAGGGAWRLYVQLIWEGDLVTRLRAYPTRAEALADPGAR
jgi:ketosteroid isomerase-like protein